MSNPTISNPKPPSWADQLKVFQPLPYVGLTMGEMMVQRLQDIDYPHLCQHAPKPVPDSAPEMYRIDCMHCLTNGEGIILYKNGRRFCICINCNYEQKITDYDYDCEHLILEDPSAYYAEHVRSLRLERIAYSTVGVAATPTAVTPPLLDDIMDRIGLNVANAVIRKYSPSPRASAERQQMEH